MKMEDRWALDEFDENDIEDDNEEKKPEEENKTE